MKIKSIKKNGIKPTWDLTVPKEEHYVMSNGCVSHNTAQILGNNECFEPYTSNLYKRNVLSGEFVIVNKHLVNDLINIGLWNDKIRLEIMKNNGSIQSIDEIPTELKEVYKTVWEMKTSNIIDMAADRGKYICQSQSMNLFMRDVNVAKLNKALFYGWRKGLKTGMYYLRSNAKAEARKSLGMDDSIPEVENKVVEDKPTIDPTLSNAEIEAINNLACSLDNPDACDYCSG